MFILTIRTDKQEAEVGLYDGNKQLAYEKWQAHRELAKAINTKIIDVLQTGDVRLHQLQGIVAYRGPGSFTGLRIGMSVANALAYSLGIPIVSTVKEDWLQTGIARLAGSDDEKVALPEYGALPNITQPKH